MLKTVNLGVDVGSISTKGVLLDNQGNIVASEYLWTEGNPVLAVKQLIQSLMAQPKDKVKIGAVGTTGSARRLVGSMLEADTVKNEITAHAVGTLSRYPEVKTILEIGGQDSKLILIENGIVKDYAMNTLCAAGTGAFLSSQAKRLGIKVEEIGDMALRSKNPSKIAARCTVFAESDMVHKAQTGHSKEDLIAGLCTAVVSNYLNNVGKGKSIRPPVVFQGGVSKNKGVIEAFKQEIAQEIYVDADSHLMGAIGAAVLAAKAPPRSVPFCNELTEMDFKTKSDQCTGCSNNCEIIRFYRNDDLIDIWGNRCEKGAGVL